MLGENREVRLLEALDDFGLGERSPQCSIELFYDRFRCCGRDKHALPGQHVHSTESELTKFPDWTAPWPQGLSLRKVPLPGRPVVRRIGAIWARASVRLQLVQAFVDEATAVIAGARRP